MNSYRVAVRIDPLWVQHFRDTAIRLCTAFGVKTNYSAVEYNTIATSEEPTPVNTISWTEAYSIGACKASPTLNCKLSGPQVGNYIWLIQRPAYVFPSIIPSRIEQGESFMVPSAWTVTTSHNADQSLKKGFHFSNEPSAAALILKRVQNVVAPIYVSTVGSHTPPPGHHSLIPNGKVLLFFLPQEAGTAFRVQDISTKFIELPYIDKGGIVVRLQYTKEGLWEIESDAHLASEPKL